MGKRGTGVEEHSLWYLLAAVMIVLANLYVILLVA